MYWALFIIAIALAWLCQRLYLFARVPVDDLVKAVNIEIPRQSKLSIDNITSSKVYIHWDLPLVEQRIVNFVVFLNGVQVSVLSGTETHCCLSGLSPNTRYKLDLVSSNSLGYKAKSDPVYLKTKSEELEKHPNSVSLENPDNLFKFLIDSDDSSNVEKLITPFSVNPNVEGRASRSRSNTVNSDLNMNLASNASTYTELPDPRSIDDIEELRYHLESGQEELHTILSQQVQTYQDFKDYETTLIQERDSLRDRKKLEDGNRQSMKSEIKMLDDTRRLTELRRAKQESLLTEKLKNIDKMESDLKEWNLKIAEFHERKEEMERNEPTIREEIRSDIDAKKVKITELNAEINNLDENIKSLSTQKKQQENLSSFTKLFKKLSNHIDEHGFVDNEGIRTLESIKSLDVEVYNKFKQSIDTDTKLEAEWRAQQQREVNRCNKLSESFKYLSAENKLLKEGISPGSIEWENGKPSSQRSSNGNVPQFNNNGYQHPVSSPPASAISYCNFNQGSSPSLNSNQNSSAPYNQISSSIWNKVQNSSDRPLSLLDTSNIENFNRDEVQSPSVDHYLPTNLIDEDDFLFDSKRVKSPLHSSESSPAQEPAPNTKEPPLTMKSFSSTSPIQLSSALNDSTTNISTKSIFHQDFEMTSRIPFQHQQSSQSAFHPASPQPSFRNDFLSMQNSPNASVNVPLNDLHSIISGSNEVPVLPSQSQSPPLAHEEGQHQHEKKQANSLNTFSPKRLSNVFNFGRKNLDTTNEFLNHHPSLSDSYNNNNSSKPQRSKFFNNHRSTHSSDSNNDSHRLNGRSNLLFNPNNGSNGNLKAPGSGSSQVLSRSSNHDEFLNSVWEPSDLRPVHKNQSSIKSIEDDASWLNFDKTNGASSSLNISRENNNLNTSSTNSLSRTDSKDGSLNPVELTSTNKSSNATSTKSLKSSNESSVSSPSFFRRKSFFGFGNSNDKSPIKRTALSPNHIDDLDPESVEDFNPNTSASSSSIAPIKLFSRNSRKSSMISLQNRKQSNSSSFQDSQNDSVTESTSSASGGRSGSIVKKLNFFKNSKEIDDIEEAVEDD